MVYHFLFNSMIMKKYIQFISTVLVLFSFEKGFSQPFIKPIYQIERKDNIEYGRAVNYSGREQPLLLNIAYPVNDEVPPCGRPLMIIIHGGAFVQGSKDDAVLDNWLQDFAKKGYVAASVDYRLGMFQPAEFITCNLDKYECLSMADTIEWHRALYRSVQDVAGAIRFLVGHKDEYRIDPDNVFLIGESAGGFIAMGVAYGDESDPEDPARLVQSDVARPNEKYDQKCKSPYSYPVDSMNLTRPDLGNPEGDQNLESGPYKIRGVASFYGGIMNDLFNDEAGTELPLLYLYAQPNDLIVPFTQGPVLGGIVSCAVSSAGCPWIKGNPYVLGNNGIYKLLKVKKAEGKEIPEYKAEFTDNYADCLTQVLFPQLTGHSIDNIGLRTANVTALFASKIDTSCAVNAVKVNHINNYILYPNPIINVLNVSNLNHFEKGAFILDCYGNRITQVYTLPVDISSLHAGMYYLKWEEQKRTNVLKFIKME